MALPLQTLELEGGSFFDGSLLDLIDDLEVRASPERVLLPHSLRSERRCCGVRGLDKYILVLG